MAIYFGGNSIPNGNPIRMNGVQPDKIMRGTTQIWINNYVAGAPTSFAATDTVVNAINFSWVLPADQGVPTCTYEVWEGATLRATAGVGVTTASWGITGPYGPGTFHVIAVNVAGSSVASNTDSGTSAKYFASPIVITSSRTITAGVDYPSNTTVNVCMIGAGGSGSMGTSNQLSGGGYGGADLATTIGPDANGVTHSIGIGVGGTNNWEGDGNPGTATTLDAHNAAGGAGGLVYQNAYGGAGGTRTTCAGTATDGTYVEWGGRGGQAGFGNGGNGGITAVGEDGGVGAGGGASANVPNDGSKIAGSGGRGEVRLTF